MASGLASLMQGAFPSTQQEIEQARAMPVTGLASLMQQNVMPGDQPGLPPIEGLPGMKKPGAFAQGGKGWQIMGIIGDALQAAGGGRPTYMPMVQEQQQLETQGRQRLAERQAEQKAQLQQALTLAAFKRANPDPTSMEQDLAAYQRMTPEQRAQLAAMYDIKSPIAVSGPTGTYRVPRDFGRPTNGPTTQTIDGQTYYQVNGKWYDNPEGR